MLAVVLVTTACDGGDTDAPAAPDAAVDDAAPDAPSDDTPDTTTDDDSDTTSDDDAGTDAEGVEPDDPTDDLAAEPDEPQPADGPLGFSARSLEGGTVDVATFAGGPVALWMWTPW